MSMFLTPLKLEAVDDGWIFSEEFRYASDSLGTVVNVPAGAFTDLASIPKFVPRWIVDVANSRNRKAACVHDLLCHDEYKAVYGISQSQADIVFMEALMICKVPMWRAILMYLAVAGYQIWVHKRAYWRKL